MSFILDALKKSETDRQRQNGPALFEVRVAPPRDGLPMWAVGLGVLLAINLVIVAWVLLRRPAAAEVGSQGQGGSAAQQPGVPQAAQAPYYGANMAPAPSMGAQQGQPYGPASNGVPVNGASPGGALGQTAGMTQPVPAGATGAGTGGPSAGTGPSMGGAGPGPSMGAGSSMSPGQAMSPGQQPVGLGQQPAGPGAVANNGAQGAAAGEKVNPDDYAPAADPGPPQPFGNHVSRATASGMPLYQDVASASHLPTLRLDLHVYAANPQERFVMINMHKLHEGDALPSEGVRVESITPFGAVLSHGGTQFVLPRD